MVPFSDQMPSATSKTLCRPHKGPKALEGCRSPPQGHRAKIKSQPCQGGAVGPGAEQGVVLVVAPGLETSGPRSLTR